MTLCRICGEALDLEGVRYAGQYPAEGLVCTSCRMVAPEFERAVAYAVYQEEVREMVHLLKYQQMRPVAKPLGRMLARAIETLEIESLGEEILIVAVPLFRAKERERGYNQAELLANAALVELQKSLPLWKLRTEHNILRRVRDTESQFTLTPSGRRRNLRGAFAVDRGEVVVNRGILLVDDIYTTGATARECARVLRRAGAAKVWVATVARAQREMVELWDAPVETAAWDPG